MLIHVLFRRLRQPIPRYPIHPSVGGEPLNRLEILDRPLGQLTEHTVKGEQLDILSVQDQNIPQKVLDSAHQKILISPPDGILRGEAGEQVHGQRSGALLYRGQVLIEEPRPGLTVGGSRDG